MKVPHEDANWNQQLRRALLRWFPKIARDLPWRKTRELYRIWISEVMLQQTQVATVIDYYQRFVASFPTVQSLAAAPEEQVLRHWEGLGYYRRARQLHAAAKRVVEIHGSEFPATFDEVLALPGIGRYTAGAILSIGADQRLPILEANSIRVLCRLAAFDGDPASTEGQRFLWQMAEAILPAKQCGQFNQALMELGSLICTPREPKCDQCPVIELCQAKQQKKVEQIPRPARKMKFEEVTAAAVVIVRQEKVLLRRCLPGERWAGLWDFPRFDRELHAGELTAAEAWPAERLIDLIRERVGLRTRCVQPLKTIRHGVTRFKITLHGFQAKYLGGKAKAGEELAWVQADELETYPLSTTGRKLAHAWLASL